MRTGDLARVVGASTQTVRYYDSAGVPPEPVRLAGGVVPLTAESAPALPGSNAARRDREHLALRDRTTGAR